MIFAHYPGGFFRKGWRAYFLPIRKIWTIKLLIILVDGELATVTVAASGLNANDVIV